MSASFLLLSVKLGLSSADLQTVYERSCNESTAFTIRLSIASTSNPTKRLSTHSQFHIQWQMLFQLVGMLIIKRMSMLHPLDHLSIDDRT